VCWAERGLQEKEGEKKKERGGENACARRLSLTITAAPSPVFRKEEGKRQKKKKKKGGGRRGETFSTHSEIIDVGERKKRKGWRGFVGFPLLYHLRASERKKETGGEEKGREDFTLYAPYHLHPSFTAAGGGKGKKKEKGEGKRKEFLAEGFQIPLHLGSSR